MGNCLQSQQNAPDAHDAHDGVDRQMSVQSLSHIEGESNDIKSLPYIHEHDGDKSSTSFTTPSISQVAPLPVVSKKNTPSLPSIVYSSPTMTTNTLCTPSSNITSSSGSIPPLNLNSYVSSTHSLETIDDNDDNGRHRASSHGTMGITVSNKSKNTKRIFSLTRLKKKKNAIFSLTPTFKPVATPSKKRKRGKTFDAPQKLNTNDDDKSIHHRLNRAQTYGILSSKSKKNCNLFYKANTSIQALESYIMEGNVRGVISILSKYEASYPPFFMEYSNEEGHTLLMKAAFLGHFGLMKYLMQRYKEYKSAVIDSIEPYYGRDVASLCLSFMGDYINYESCGGKSALIFACSCKHRCRLNIVKYLLESGASVAEPRHSKHGKSPLIYAVEWKQQNLMQLLLDYGADVNVCDSNNGFTPLMYAAKFNNRDLCDFLLARHADKKLVNNNGKTAVDLAVDDQCWASLLALDINKIPSNALSIAAASPSKNRWGRYSLSYSYL